MAVFLQPIYTQTVGSGGAASITFNNIPQTFTDLMIVMSARSSGSSDDNLRIKLNNDSSSLYSQTSLWGNGSSALSERVSSLLLDYASGGLPNASSTANTFGNTMVYMPNYAGSNFKQVISDNVSENNSTSTYIRTSLGAGLYRSTSAITRVDISCFNNLVQYSTFSLYGILRSGV